MCGIVGIVDFTGEIPVTEKLLSYMCSVIKYRGPNGEGIDIADNVGLGMRRLSIIDLEGGMQPIYNEDNTIRTVFNGEIYNFRELRKDLINAGHKFRTEGDTEVIVHAYEEYGENFATYLNGMFAIALHDVVKKKLLLVRDQIGIKPLYYYLTHRALIWGSEIKVLLASGFVKPELDLDSLNQFLTWEYVPGDSTLMRGVRKLRAAEMITVNLNNRSVQFKDYWDISEYRSEFRSDAEWLEETESAINNSVQNQLVSDVPLGAFLSGGTDSSLIASAMGKAQTFSIGFDDPSYNELAYSTQVAGHLGMIHKKEIIRPHVADLFDDLMNFLEDPIGDFSIFPTYLVSKLAKEHVTVALSGDGADEIFGGYETYLAEQMANRYVQIPGLIRRCLIEPLVTRLPPQPAKKGPVNKAKRFIEGVNQDPKLSHCRWRMYLNQDMRESVYSPEFLHSLARPVDGHILKLFSKAGDRSNLDRSLYVDVKSYLCDNILTKVDRMSMAVSLEARVPYLDTKVVDLAFQLPSKLKIHNRRTKVLLKEIAAMYVPRNCVYRPKEGFSIPIKNWLGTQFRPIMDEFLSETRIRSQGLFDVGSVEKIKNQHLSGQINHSHLLWCLIVFEAWHDKWLKSSMLSLAR